MLVSFFVPVETKSRSAQPVTEEASLALIFLVFFSFHVSLFQTFKISTLAFFFFFLFSSLRRSSQPSSVHSAPKNARIARRCPSRSLHRRQRIGGAPSSPARTRTLTSSRARGGEERGGPAAAPASSLASASSSPRHFPPAPSNVAARESSQIPPERAQA